MTDEGKQLTLWEPVFDERIRRVEVNGETHFSVLDVFQHYGNKANPTQSWRAVLKALQKQGFDSSTQIVELQFPGERQRKTPTATFKTFLRIAQVADIKEWEYIRSWMAEVASERIEEEYNPSKAIDNGLSKIERAALRLGHDLSWVPDRILSTEARKYLAALIDAHWSGDRQMFIHATNQTYRGLFGGDASEIRRRLGLTKPSQNPRDYMSSLALAFIRIAELTCGRKLEDTDLISREDFLRFVEVVCELIGRQVNETEHLLQADILTGRKLLGPVDAVRGA